jgi:hypothetical protein
MTDIRVSYWMKPGPLRCMDYSATRGGPDLGCRVGYGASEAEAVEDLLEQEGEE